MQTVKEEEDDLSRIENDRLLHNHTARIPGPLFVVKRVQKPVNYSTYSN
jgi:hypothetical protein